ncbi:MAG: hypothetical protein ABIA37_00645 [Candidatus Woesearchaeota archaeon]
MNERKKMPQKTTQPKLKVRKEVVIAGIAILSVIVLLGLFFLGTQFVGKATGTGANIGEDITIDRSVGNVITISYTGTTSISGVYFELSSTQIKEICKIVPITSIETLLWNGNFTYKKCDLINNKIIFADATLNDTEFKSGTVPIIRFTLNPPEVDLVNLQLSPLDVYNDKGEDLFDSAVETITIQCTKDATRSCGDNIGACTAGTQICQADETWGNCTGGIGPVNETCNGLDDNCDNQTDEGMVCNDNLNCGAFGILCEANQNCVNATCENVTIAPVTPTIDVSGGGGGRRCTPEWSCGYFTICGPELIQKRTCYDRALCESPKEENRTCEPCDESWICTAWSNCIGGTQSRSCYEEHNCETAEEKPDESQSCVETSTYVPPPAYTPPVVEYTPPPVVAAPVSAWTQFWDKWKTWLVLIPSLLILAMVGLLLYLHFHKPKTEVGNMDELKDWVGQELEMGVSKEDIRKTLHENTGWTDEELDMAFKELKTEEAPQEQPEGQPPTPPAQ